MKNFLKSTLGIVLSVAVLGGTVWVASKAWKKGQEEKK
jgi:hypothetical protein